jgi:hypothetical protein
MFRWLSRSLWLGHLGIEEEVETLEGFVGLEGRAAQALLKLLALAPFDLIVEHTQQKLGWMNIVFDALSDA